MTLSARVAVNVVVPKIEEVFPWVQHLTENEQAQFWDELLTAFHNAMQSGDWPALKQALEDWKATAEVKAVPTLESALLQDVRRGEWVNWNHARASLHHRGRKKGAQRS